MNRTPVYDMPVKTGLESFVAHMETTSNMSLLPTTSGVIRRVLSPAAWIVAPDNSCVAVAKVATALLSQCSRCSPLFAHNCHFIHPNLLRTNEE